MRSAREGNIIRVGERYAYDSKDRPLGRGQFGAVYKGVDLTTKSLVAIKVVNKHSFVYQRNKQAYIMEGKILKQITGEYFVNGFGTYESGHELYFVMEYCDGGSLETLMVKKGLLSEDESLKIVYQIACAFADLSVGGDKKQKMIHRDIKPANILFSRDKIKIADFGLSKILYETEQSKKEHHTLTGTPIYMAPQLLKLEPYSNKCDVFSTGVLLYELLHGKAPWGNLGYTGILRNRYLSPTPEFSYKLSKDTIDLLKGMLQIEEENRFDWKAVQAHPAFSKFFKKKEKIFRVIADEVTEPQVEYQVLSEIQSQRSLGGLPTEEELVVIPVKKKPRFTIRIIEETFPLESQPQYSYVNSKGTVKVLAENQ